ncbi:hypothetical protein BD847_2363 [Flavobacterium cutihirudinis]|uniref:Uncharacterized protein n=1 Tax=Flavobacterium cutihirudinis TaxID=1265740 RepID=A0A3D9FRV8_9FLAO|nr:hypothetical protein [Flavobacterium cutihirudinis]RED23315.1 hypothetical protein BD847_2363 [Flavobacterium cutihirudinis]
MEITIVSIISTLVLTTLVWIIFFKNIQSKLTHDKEKLSIELFNIKANIDFEVNRKLEEKVTILNEQILELKNKCITIERESYEKGKKDASKEFEKDYFVNVIPYKETYEADREYIIFGKKSKYVNVGFQRQLFVKGIPVFEPVYSFVERYEFNEFKLNEEAINRLVNNAIKAIAPQAGTFIKVTEDVMEK